MREGPQRPLPHVHPLCLNQFQRDHYRRLIPMGIGIIFAAAIHIISLALALVIRVVALIIGYSLQAIIWLFFAVLRGLTWLAFQSFLIAERSVLVLRTI